MNEKTTTPEDNKKDVFKEAFDKTYNLAIDHAIEAIINSCYKYKDGVVYSEEEIFFNRKASEIVSQLEKLKSK